MEKNNPESKIYNDLINISDLDLVLKNPINEIYYKNILLFTTVDNSLEKYKIEILDETDFFMGFVTIQLTDSEGDYFYYGKFSSLEKCKEWLKNPVELY